MQNTNQNSFENIKKLTPMMAQYIQIKDKFRDTLLLYRMGDFYEMFFDDAKDGSEALGIALTQRGKIEDEDIPMCGVPVHAIDSYLSKLIEKGFKVAICEQSETVESFKERGGKGPLPREVVRVITPGTIQEDELLDPTKNNYLASIGSASGKMAIAWTDMSTGIFRVQCCENNEIENILHFIQPAELIFAEYFSETLSSLRSEYKITIQPDFYFDSQKSKSILKELYSVDDLQGIGEIRREMLSAAGGLLNYLKQTQLNFMPKLKRLKIIQKDEFMFIDSATRKSLELTLSLNNDKKGSLLYAIDKTLTAGGSRLFSQRLSSPLVDKTKIEKRLNLIEVFLKNKTLSKDVCNILNQIGDVERCLSRLINGRGGPRDLYSLGLSLDRANLISKLLKVFKDKNNLEINLFVKNLSKTFEISNNLLEALEVQSPMFSRDGNFIKKGFNSSLDEIKEFKNDKKKLITKLENKYSKKTSISSLKIKFNNVLGYHIEVRTIHGNKLLNREEFIHRQTTAQALRFGTIELSQMEKDINLSNEKALSIELKIYEELLLKVKKNVHKINETSKILSKIDVATASAKLAYLNNFCKPIISEDKKFKIISGRHPVVEMISDKKNEFIVNDCNLSENKDIWLLTGPNMAGKSTYLRQNAIIIILAQSGFYVPAEWAEIGIVDKVFSRVGASDDLAHGRSTFMMEMLETAAILNQATIKSFVIMDEIGRGTATWDGLAIAWACLEYIHQKICCRTLFATHYHELTALEKKLRRIRPSAMSIKEWEGEIIFLYKIIEGVADRSYGLHVAKIAGLPKEVVKRANILLKNLERQTVSDQSLKEVQLNLSLFEKEESGLNSNIKNSSEVEKILSKIIPDNLSPREALEKIYELVEILNTEKK